MTNPNPNPNPNTMRAAAGTGRGLTNAEGEFLTPTKHDTAAQLQVKLTDAKAAAEFQYQPNAFTEPAGGGAAIGNFRGDHFFLSNMFPSHSYCVCAGGAGEAAKLNRTWLLALCMT